jgi:hypothetical protein
MALKLSSGKPRARRVEIGGDVALMLRPATYPESIEAAERMLPLIAGLRDGSDAAVALAGLLGDEFAGAVWGDAALNAAAHKLALIELVVLCCEGIEGQLVGEDDKPIAMTLGEGEAIDKATAALLLRDPMIGRVLRAVIEGPLHEAIAEKKGSAPSPGGAAARQAIATDAAQAGPTVPPAGAD